MATSKSDLRVGTIVRLSADFLAAQNERNATLHGATFRPYTTADTFRVVDLFERITYRKPDRVAVTNVERANGLAFGVPLGAIAEVVN